MFPSKQIKLIQRTRFYKTNQCLFNFCVLILIKWFLFSRGEISSTAEIDYETKAEYNISITVSDGRFVSIIKISKNLIDKEEISPVSFCF